MVVQPRMMMIYFSSPWKELCQSGSSSPMIKKVDRHTPQREPSSRALGILLFTGSSVIFWPLKEVPAGRTKDFS